VNVEAAFVTSAAGDADFPRADLPEIALAGRSNVGKSSLINALVGRRLARTSAAPGKTRLANVYRVRRGAAAPLLLVDLPGYGYARGGGDGQFEALTRAYFQRAGLKGAPAGAAGRREAGRARAAPASGSEAPREQDGSRSSAVLLLVDARHPGLDSDRQAWDWLTATVANRAIVATKIDKLARGQRIRALSACESVFQHPVTPVSAVTGEGLEELWILINTLASRSEPNRSRSDKPRQARPPAHDPSGPENTSGPRRPRSWSASSSRRSRT
jgi:GTP-binding protein